MNSSGCIVHIHSVFCSQAGRVSEGEARLRRQQQWVRLRARIGRCRLQARAWALSSTLASARWNPGRAWTRLWQEAKASACRSVFRVWMMLRSSTSLRWVSHFHMKFRLCWSSLCANYAGRPLEHEMLLRQYWKWKLFIYLINQSECFTNFDWVSKKFVLLN